MPRFVVLKHEEEAGLHFDLMLEQAGVLVTFAFAEFPAPGATGEQIADHRLEYLKFEGDIGGGKGVVTRVERGSYDLLFSSPDEFFAFLRGARLRGNIRLRRAGDAWKLEGE